MLFLTRARIAVGVASTISGVVNVAGSGSEITDGSEGVSGVGVGVTDAEGLVGRL